MRRCGNSPAAILSSYAFSTLAIMSVRIIPGRISKTFTPISASRCAYSATDMLRPAFEMQYSPRFTDAVYAEIDVTNTMRPSPRSAIQRAACWVRKYGPFRFTAINSSKLSSVASRMSRRSRGAIPALFTSRSRLWKRSRAKRISASRSSRDARSHWKISHPVSSRNDSAASRRPRYVPITLCVLANSIARARPMPRLAPVTMLLGLGKSVVDSLRDFLESEDFDEWRAVHQRGGRVDDPAAHAFLEVLLD